MIKRVEHIGIAVKNATESQELFRRILGDDAYKTEFVESEQVRTVFFQPGETKIELLDSENPDSAISKFLEKKGEGIHHIAFEVDDIRATIRDMQEKGFTVLYPEPKRGADNKLITFLHPKSTNGVLVEFCQSLEA